MLLVRTTAISRACVSEAEPDVTSCICEARQLHRSNLIVEVRSSHRALWRSMLMGGAMRVWSIAILCLIAQPLSASADVTSVTITARSVVADGHAFGATGSYEKLVGQIEFSIDPEDPRNARIADLAFAPRDAAAALTHTSRRRSTRSRAPR